MIYSIIIAQSLLLGILQAIEPGQLHIPSKLNAIQMAESNQRAQVWYKNKIAQRKIGVAHLLQSLFPYVLSQLMQDYENQYSDEWITVEITRLARHKKNSPTNSLLIDIPLQWSDHSVNHRDVFKASEVFLNQPMSVREWRDNIATPQMKDNFINFLTEISGNFRIHHPSIVVVPLPEIDHFPFRVYFNQETIPLARSISASRPKKWYHECIRDVCAEILKRHNKVPADTLAEKFTIFCTACNGKLKWPEKTCFFLVMSQKKLIEDVASPFCNGNSVRCHTPRALRVYYHESTHKRKVPCS